MRKMATIRTIGKIFPIEGADAIEAARVDGWTVVVKKGQFSEGDSVIYAEIDSWIPTEIAPYLTRHDGRPKEYLGVKGERLRTIRLRGQLSQGLILPLSLLDGKLASFDDGDDVSELLGIVKWEAPDPAILGGAPRGNFPGWMRKTDQERIQNCFRDLSREDENFNCELDGRWYGEEKLDGSSMSVGYLNGEIHVCSRNLSIRLDAEDNAFIRAAKASNIIMALELYGRNIAVSGELVGEGIQGNRYKLRGQKWFVFDVYDVEANRYLSYVDRLKVIVDLTKLGADFEETPMLYQTSLSQWDVEKFLANAEGKSALCAEAEREGVVWKRSNDGDKSFKAISNKFLTSGGE